MSANNWEGAKDKILLHSKAKRRKIEFVAAKNIPASIAPGPSTSLAKPEVNNANKPTNSTPKVETNVF